MDIADLVTTEYPDIETTTRVSKLLGAFADRERRALVVTGAAASR